MGDARLNVTVIDVPSLEPAGIVVSQSHEPGTTVSQGTFITIHVSTGETPQAPLPSLIGQTFEEAIETISEFDLVTGVKISLVQQKVDTTDPRQVYRVISTNPAPGAEITESATVLLLIGRLVQPDP